MNGKNSLVFASVLLACVACASTASAAYFDGNTVYGGNNSGDSIIVASNPFGDGGIITKGNGIVPEFDAAQDFGKGGSHPLAYGHLWLAYQLHMRSQGSMAYASFITSPWQTASWTWVLPAQQGTSGSVLTNDGNGILSWNSCVPSGAVIQFHKASCPVGWKPFGFMGSGLVSCEKS
jgi:hypothetical protein